MAELRQVFQDSVDDYLAFCAARNEPPERPYSGTFTVRVAPEVHRSVSVQARTANKSLNSYVSDLLEQSLLQAALGGGFRQSAKATACAS